MVNTHLIGQFGEELACDYLAINKLKIVARNYRTRFGEIDIIAWDGKQFVFIEVKAKNTSNFGKPYEMVTERKKKKIVATAKSYLLDHGHDLETQDWRIDIVSIDYENSKVEWLKNAVEDNGKI